MIVLTAISGIGALVATGFLIRNLLARRSLIAASKFPAYVRMSCNLSHLVTLFCILPWGIATIFAVDLWTWIALMVSPIFLGFVLSSVVWRFTKNDDPEATQYYTEELSERSQYWKKMSERYKIGQR